METPVKSYRVERDIEIPMRDGAVLRGDIWLPSGQGPFAAIVFRTPYNKAALVSDFLRPQQAVEAGFSVVVQDCRGRFRSDGEWRPLMWEQEGEDSYDTIEWAASQPCCSGAVGMAGMSYLGIVQIAGAMLKPPHLKAIAPALCSVARHERPERGGAFWLDHLFGWTAGMTIEWVQRQKASGRSISSQSEAIVSLALSNPRAMMDHRPLSEAPLFSLPGFDIGFDQLSSDTATPDFDVSAIDIPILSTGGWYDLYIRGTLGLFTDKPPGAERRLIVGPWIHSTSLTGFVGQVNFSTRAAAFAAGVALDHLTFFRRHLLDERIDTPPVRYFLMGHNEWCTSAVWPPAESRPHRFFLRSGRCLSAKNPDAGEEADYYRFDPSNPTPTIGGRTMPSCTLTAGPIDQAALSRRSDVLHFDSIPVNREMDIVGKVDARIFVATTARSFDIVVKLIDIAPDGIALLITDGIKRSDHAAGDAFQRVDVSLADTAWRLHSGHRLRVQVQSGNYPHFDANPGTGNPLGSDRDGRPAMIGIGHANSSESFVEFGVLDSVRP